MPEPSAYLCRQHEGQLGPSAGSGGAAGAAAPAATRVLIRALPQALRQAALLGLQAALAAVANWAKDPDMQDLTDDLVDTLTFGAVTTRAKSESALTRLDEFLPATPPALQQAEATAGVVDVLLSSYVSARLRVAKRTPPPPAWASPKQVPEPTTVKGEVMALVGLCRMAAILPADPRGTLPLTRRVLRKTGCYAKHAASPRAYTFLWELAEAWRSGAVPRDNPQAVAAFGMFLTAVQLLLRPLYARSLESGQLSLERARQFAYRLEWDKGDKSRQPALTAAAAAAGAAAAGAGGAAGSAEPRGSRRRRAEADLLANLPAKHPRVTGTCGKLMHHVVETWRRFRGDESGPLFCRTEPARQTGKVPRGALLKQWQYRDGLTVPCFVWPASKMSERTLKRWLVTFITPVAGPTRAKARVLSGLRGGGAMELESIDAPLAVRATVGWWVARRLSAEGALVTYIGCSMEAMWEWTSRLGQQRIRVRAPGVFRLLSNTFPPRGIRARVAARAPPASVSAAAVPAAASAAATAAAGGAAAPRSAATASCM